MRTNAPSNQPVGPLYLRLNAVVSYDPTLPESVDDVVNAVCRVAFDFYAVGTASPVQLVEASGYSRHRDEITVARLAERLAQHPEWAGAWFDYSEDKRTSTGWYIEGRDPEDSRVGYYEGGSSEPPTRYSDKAWACAEFVRHEVDRIAGRHGERASS